MRVRTIRSKVVGVTFPNPDGSDRQRIIRKFCRAGKSLDVRLEPQNPHSKNAIGLWVEGRRFVVFPARYQIAPGDTLSAVAARFGLPGGWQALYAANRAVIGHDPNVIRAKVPVVKTFRGEATAAMHQGGLANWALSMGRQRLGVLTLQNMPQFLQNLPLRGRIPSSPTNTLDVAALDLIRLRAVGITWRVPARVMGPGSSRAPSPRCPLLVNVSMLLPSILSQ